MDKHRVPLLTGAVALVFTVIAADFAPPHDGQDHQPHPHPAKVSASVSSATSPTQLGGPDWITITAGAPSVPNPILHADHDVVPPGPQSPATDVSSGSNAVEYIWGGETSRST